MAKQREGVSINSDCGTPATGRLGEGGRRRDHREVVVVVVGTREMQESLANWVQILAVHYPSATLS